MSAEKTCPTCHSPIPGDGTDGLCLKCLGQLGFLSDSPAPLQGGLLRLGNYELLEEIARSGMGVVYRARQLSLNRIVALKVLLHGPFSSPDFVRRFRHEAKVIAALRHPNIVTIYEVGEDSGNHFLSLEYVEGRGFAQFAGADHLPARRAAGYLKTIAEAVEYAHRHGVLHRDLKPSNILLDIFDQPRVTDFGLAKLENHDTTLTVTGQVMGSPNYLPPEQASGKACTPASDVYSLGAILYELLTGRPPFQGESITSILSQVQAADPVLPRRLNPGAPLDLQTICLKCLQKEPARRYHSAQALADDLGRFVDGKPILARPVPLPERGWLWCRRHPLLAALSVGLVMAVALGVAGIAWQWQRAESHAQGEFQQRLRAQRDAALTRLNLYAADVDVASQAIQRANFGLARRTLEALRPKPGETDLRGFEWRYLWNLCRGDQLATLPGHEGTVTCAAFSPDGNRLATGGHDGTVKVWDAAQHACLATLKITPASVWTVAFTPDGKGLVAGCNENIQFWDTDSWKMRTNFPGLQAAVSRTGTLLAATESNPFFFEPAGAVTLWNWRTTEVLRRFEQPARTAALSSDGRLLAVAGTNNLISVLDTASGLALRQWPSKDPVWALSFSPDDRSVIAAGWSQDVLLCRWNDPAPKIISGHQLHVWSAAFSPDGETIATTSSDQTVRLWDAATLKPKGILRGHQSEVWCAAFSPRDNLLATGGKDENVLLWRAAVANRSIQFPHDVDCRPIFSADGKLLITVKPDSKRFMLWNAQTGALLSEDLANGQLITGFSRDGACVASFDTVDWRLSFWPPGATHPQREVELDGKPPRKTPSVFAALSPDQEAFSVIDGAGTIFVWNADNGHLLRLFKGPAPPIRNALLSAHGKQLAVSVESQKVAWLFDCATGTEHRLAGHRDFVSGLAFSADGASLATGSVDGTIRLWNTTNGTFAASLPGHLQETTDVAFSPDGRTLASLGRGESLKLWHLPTLREVVSQNEPHAGAWVRFSPDGSKLAFESDTNRLNFLFAPSE